MKTSTIVLSAVLALVLLAPVQSQAVTATPHSTIELDFPIRELPDLPVCRFGKKCDETKETTPAVIRSAGNTGCLAFWPAEMVGGRKDIHTPCWSDMQKAIIELNK